jgi:23S rRNA (cytidine1920-2'-O)/16S rRNA (cytidine1409-2'-O)-methyltransferase
LGLTFSPIKGPEGNIEYLLYIKKSKDKTDLEAWDQKICDIVAESHGTM